MFIRKIRMVLHFHTKTTHSPCSPKNNKSPPKTSEVGHKFLSVLQTTEQSLRNTDDCCNYVAHLHENCQCYVVWIYMSCRKFLVKWKQMKWKNCGNSWWAFARWRAVLSVGQSGGRFWTIHILRRQLFGHFLTNPLCIKEFCNRRLWLVHLARNHRA